MLMQRCLSASDKHSISLPCRKKPGRQQIQQTGNTNRRSSMQNDLVYQPDTTFSFSNHHQISAMSPP
ncbi:hypothetical protein EAE91_10835 [Photorhabdus noenieputensis]|uniref:hypothetical protein n=1 Tax=Photorhabdus noenieputensis TaxID=1208607 RepID=UPI001BD3A0DC|nr:hypothetical protein [Photorhabdus noenieputensis]MBS9437644.1 hypothetical protein [Photorhabdus noenieputensis]MCK3670713.1 hypothetical protein [Photorhabdus noenieputensis]